MNIKKLFIALLMFSSVVFLCSCGASSSITGDKLNYSEEEIGLHSISGLQGIYIKNPDGSFSPLVSGLDGYTPGKETSPERYFWFNENLVKVTELIPEVGEGSELVLIYNTDNALPVNFTLEKYEFCGYTVGAHFTKEDRYCYIKTRNTLPNTSAASALSYLDDEAKYEVTSINGKKVPLSNINNSMELLLGLEYGKYYEVELFKGTKCVSTLLQADSLVFQSTSLSLIDNAYTKTKDGYFKINLPNGLEKGYYYICGLGLFYYGGN